MKWLSLINKIAFVVALSICSFAVYMILSPCNKVEADSISFPSKRVDTPFSKSQPDNWASLKLRYHRPTVQLPDLTSEIKLVGFNQRPDCSDSTQMAHLTFNGVKETVTARLNKPLYLSFTSRAGEGTYTPSIDNQPTNLWITPKLVDDERLLITVQMRSAEGELIAEPATHAEFILTATQKSRPHRTWQIDDMKVDNSLLAKLKARWYGEDLFLKNHGGEEYSYSVDKQKIYFGTGDEEYSCFIALDGVLIYKEGRWSEPGSEPTHNYPLLHAQKVDDKLLVFDVWNVGGTAKTTLSMMRSRAPYHPPQKEAALQFTGIKTWSQYVLASGPDRLSITPNEWLLLTESGWIKLDTVELIDDYVDMRLKGELLVIEGMKRDESGQVLSGLHYNATRSDVKDVLLPLTPEFDLGNQMKPGGKVS